MKRKTIGVAAVFMALAVLAPAVEAWGKETRWILDLSGEGKFFDLPYPTELRRMDDGTIDMSGFPNPYDMEMIERAADSASKGYGYSTAPTVYFRFKGPGVDPDLFPQPAETMAKGAKLFIIDVDPSSPEKGKHFPVVARYYKYGARQMKSQRNLLALMPVPGFVLRENTLYAAGVRRSVGGKDGGLTPNDDLLKIAAGQKPDAPLGQKALDAYGPALAYLAEMGAEADKLAALTVFRTGDPTARMQKLFDGVKDMTGLDIRQPFTRTRDYELYSVLEGVVMMPQFQDGTPPYGHGKGGRISFDEKGKPIVRRHDEVPVAISVPKGKMPPKGFPLTIYIHGTAGVSTQFIDRGEVKGKDKARHHNIIREMITPPDKAPEGTGPALIYALHGIAGAGAAQQHAGERGGLDAQLFYYNFLSPEALRDNMLQAAAEAAMLLRFLANLEIDPSLCPDTDSGGNPIAFDPDLVFATGQSLGSLILGPWGAVETEVKILMPAGNGAYWQLFLSEGNAFSLNFLRRKQKGQGEFLKFDRYHPYISLMSQVLAEGDPFAYQPHYYKRPLPGRDPKHIWASFGQGDNYFYPVSQNAAILCMGLDFAGEVAEPSVLDALEIGGLEKLEYPVKSNAKSETGEKVTAVAEQFKEHGPLNGHHVNYQREDAKYQYGCFLESMVKDGVPTLYEAGDAWDAECGQ